MRFSLQSPGIGGGIATRLASHFSLLALVGYLQNSVQQYRACYLTGVSAKASCYTGEINLLVNLSLDTQVKHVEFVIVKLEIELEKYEII